MSVQEYTQPEIVAAYSRAVSVEYIHLAAITIIVYDSLTVFHREREYIYKGQRTLIKWIYILIKLVAITILVLNFIGVNLDEQHIGYHLKHQRCLLRQWFAGFLFEVVDTAVIKTLLVLRLRALYFNNKPVATLLWVATAVELLSTIYAYILTGLNLQHYIISPSPIPGCPFQKKNQLRYLRSPTVVWATRFTSNTLELILLLFGLRQSLKETRSHFRVGLSRIRRMAPILYVFYRDGTIFYIPVCALTMFGFIATLTNLTTKFNCSNWEAWLAITYYIAGTRLILNIRQAGLKISTSMIMGQQVSSIAFESGVQGGGAGGGGREEAGLSTVEEEEEEEEEDDEGEEGGEEEEEEEIGVSFE